MRQVGVRVARQNNANSVLAWLIANPDIYIRLGQLVARAVTAEVDRRSAAERRSLGNAEHLICRMLEDMAAAVEALGRIPELAAGALADAAFPRPESLREKVMKAALRTAAHRVFAMAGTTQVDVLLKALRVGALLACPDLAEHPSLDRSCGEPLAGEAAQAAIKERLEHAADIGRLRT